MQAPDHRSAWLWGGDPNLGSTHPHLCRMLPKENRPIAFSLDGTWQPVKDYVHNVMGVPEEEQCFFDAWDEEKIS